MKRQPLTVTIGCETCGMKSFTTQRVVVDPAGAIFVTMACCPECLSRAVVDEYRRDTRKAEAAHGTPPWPRTQVPEFISAKLLEREPASVESQPSIIVPGG